jgi:methionyl aminopeptidase
VIELKYPDQIKLMAEAGRRLARVIRLLTELVKPGITTWEIDTHARELIRAGGDEPSFLGYVPTGAHTPYPATLCASINASVVHGIPTKQPLKEGDIVTLDLGLIHKGWHADMARTIAVGSIPERTRDLISATEEALVAGCSAALPGKHLGDISAEIARVARKYKVNVVEGLGGHGIGRTLHEDPYVANTGKSGKGVRLQPGLVLAIEPMFSLGSRLIQQMDDDSFATFDGSLSAHTEDTIAITEDGPVILTSEACPL